MINPRTIEPKMTALLIEGISKANSAMMSTYVTHKAQANPPCIKRIWSNPKAEKLHNFFNFAMLTLLDQLPPQNQQQRLVTLAAEGLTPEQVHAAISSLAADLLLLLLPEAEALRVLGRVQAKKQDGKKG